MSAGFNTNEARRQLLEEWQNVAALELAANDDITCRGFEKPTLRYRGRLS
jgi:hypothetical protein